MSFWNVYYIGTTNLAVARILARSARAAIAVASEMVSTPTHYLTAKRVYP